MGNAIGRIKYKIKKGSVIFTIWENSATKDGESVKLLNFTITRVYMNKKTQKWNYTPYFNKGNLPDIIEAVSEYISNYTETYPEPNEESNGDVS